MNKLTPIKFLRLGQGLFFIIWIFIFSNYYRSNFPNSNYTILVGFNIIALTLTWIIHVHLLIPKLLDKKQYIVYTFGIIILILFFAEGLLFAEKKISILEEWAFFRERYYHSLQPRSFYWYGEQVGVVLVILLCSGLFAFVKKWINNLLHQSQLEKEKLQAELKMLKAQINPHFLFNTLNNIYTLAYMKADNAAPMVEKLSALMRYMLSECASKRVNLIRELNFLESYIELQSLKKTEAYNVDFYTEGICQKHEIAPLILINFVENAFKHSDIETNPNGWIQLSCVVNEKETLQFTIENSKREIPVKNGEGFGLKGTEQLLALNYPEKHKLQMETNENTFKIDLVIQL